MAVMLLIWCEDKRYYGSAPSFPETKDQILHPQNKTLTLTDSDVSVPFESYD